MAIDIRSAVYSDLLLNRGIDRIVDDESEIALLPERSRLLPWELGHVPELQRLLVPPSLNAILDAAVRPDVSDQLLLSPANFRAALSDAENVLRTSITGDAGDDEMLRRGARELSEQSSLYKLLWHYWNALLQG